MMLKTWINFNQFVKILVKCLQFINKFVYHRFMKRKCRNLSIAVVSVLFVVVFVCMVAIFNKPKGAIIYADTINFTTTIGSFEMFIGNELVLNESLVQINPSNCSVKPKFTIRKSGEDEERDITTNRYLFSEAGKYILTSKVKVDKDHYISDNINITVVNIITEDTSMYIDKLPLQTVYVEEEIELTKLAKLHYPILGEIKVSCSEHITYSQGKINAIKDGAASIDVIIKYENLIIMETIPLIVKAKVEDTGTNLIVSVGGNIVENNRLELTYSQFSFAINYELTNLEHNQEINCWTDSDIVSVISYNAPTIVLKPLSFGEAIIYVSPIDHPSIVFEIIITIV